jgi:hypothetical protein
MRLRVDRTEAGEEGLVEMAIRGQDSTAAKVRPWRKSRELPSRSVMRPQASWITNELAASSYNVSTDAAIESRRSAFAV